MGSAIALRLQAAGAAVTLASPGAWIGGWTNYTEEHSLVMQALFEAGVETLTGHWLAEFEPGGAKLVCNYSGRERRVAADCIVPVGARLPNDALWRQLDSRRADFVERGGLTLQRIGDCCAPGMIAAAVYAGHRAARELGEKTAAVKRDRVVLS